MTWEEIIIEIRKNKDWDYLVEGCYYFEELEKNVKLFSESEEFKETLRFFNKYQKDQQSVIIDIGAGNGVASVSFALAGFRVIALEPDPSNTIGSGAIKILKEKYALPNLTIFTEWGENIPVETASCDIVYLRQAMHHAKDLDKFVKECSRILKVNGLFFANRDHVVNDENQLKEFLNTHPLHKFYGGENAFTLHAYKQAIQKADLEIREIISYYDNVILWDKFLSPSYFKDKLYALLEAKIKLVLGIKLASFIAQSISQFGFFQNLYKIYEKKKTHDYKHVAGRCYAFIALKK
jgi:SAM-dependent methyltransferase